MQTEVKITVPEGMEIDKENSTFECIKFKPKKLTYNDIVKELFYDKDAFYVDTSSEIVGIHVTSLCANNATSREQCEKLLALNKLINVATYLNEGWKADFRGTSVVYHHVVFNDGTVDYSRAYNANPGVPCFKTPALVQKATEILGEETIRTALSQV